MIGSIKREGLEALEKDFSDVAKKAKTYMQARVNATCHKGYATGKLEGSIVNERSGKWHWQVGSHLDYASFVNNGRDVEYPRNRETGRLYLKPPLDFWLPPGVPVKGMEGKEFIESTKQYIEDIVLF